MTYARTPTRSHDRPGRRRPVNCVTGRRSDGATAAVVQGRAYGGACVPQTQKGGGEGDCEALSVRSVLMCSVLCGVLDIITL